MYAGFPEEGDRCSQPGCKGSLHFPRSENCSCHISPPCHSCTSVVLTCSECGWEDDSPEETYVSAAPGLAMLEYKQHPLDPTRISWRNQMHSGCSMKKVGVYPGSGNTAAEREAVRKEVDGTFGGHFESFGNGKFSFIAYTD